jgi:hypothetical protein
MAKNFEKTLKRIRDDFRTTNLDSLPPGVGGGIGFYDSNNAACSSSGHKIIYIIIMIINYSNGLELVLPICIESTGARWGKACDDFFKKVLKANSKGNESVYRASSNYWLSRLSCCLQKSIAASIIDSQQVQAHQR